MIICEYTKIKKELILNEIDSYSFQNFVDKLNENDFVITYIEKKTKSISYTQLKKIHACIREISNETGHTFHEIKLIVKYYSGLIIKNKEKSFADLNKSEIESVFSVLFDLGDFVNINFR